MLKTTWIMCQIFWDCKFWGNILLDELICSGISLELNLHHCINLLYHAVCPFVAHGILWQTQIPRSDQSTVALCYQPLPLQNFCINGICYLNRSLSSISCLVFSLDIAAAVYAALRLQYAVPPINLKRGLRFRYTPLLSNYKAPLKCVWAR